MAHLRRVLRRLAALFRSHRAESELAREIDAHLRLLEDKYLAQGLGAVEARQAARREFGGVEQAKEHQRDARTFRPLAGATMDLKLGARMLVKSPGLTIVGVVALAVAIGGGAAYFEFVNDWARPTLSFPGGDRLVGIVTIDVTKHQVTTRSAWEFDVWRRELRTIQDLGASRVLAETFITDDGRADPVHSAEVSASAFRVMPVAPLLGRPLVDDDERPGAPPVVVIGHDVWRDRFRGDPNVVGRTVRLGRVPHEIVGVMPETFGFPTNRNCWTPLRLEAASLTRGAGPAIRIFGRLAPGVTLEAAQREIDAVRAAWPDAAAHEHLRPRVDYYATSIRTEDQLGHEMTILYSINFVFIILLGICGANVATLVFARTVTREAEITVRTALGASRSRIVAQLVAEALVLAGVATGVGLAGASFILRLVRDIFTEAQGQRLPFWWDAALDTETILYSAVLAVIAALLVGGVPALKATGRQMQGRLKQAGASGGTTRFGTLWTSVIVSQVAVTVVFLVAVVALGWEALDLNRKFVQVAFPRADYLAANVSMPDGTPPGRRRLVFDELERRLRQEPSVADVTYATRLPAMGAEEFRVELASQARQAEAVARGGDDVLWVRSARVSATYFETFGQAIVAGRTFTRSEAESNRPVAVVDESFVRLVLGERGGRAALGQQVRQPARGAGGEPGPWFEIVGVVKDMSRTPARKTPEAMLYRPLGADESSVEMVIHARGAASSAASPLRIAAVAVDPALRLRDVLPLDQAAEVEARTLGYVIKAIAIVAGVALLLSTAGIYALISFTLSRRTREIGIRAALGASPRRVIAGLLRRSLLQVGLGVAIGSLPGAAFMSQQAKEYASTAMTGIALTAGVAAFIVAVAAISCIVPVRRALRIQPTEALRADG
jgi:predicted permease